MIRRTLPALLLLLAACSDDGVGQTTAALINLPPQDTTVCAALAIDYRNNVGSLAVVGLPSMTVVKDVLPQAISGDAVMRAAEGKLYVVNRLADNVTVIDPVGVDGQKWKVDMQFSTGGASNPQDIAVKDGKAWVVLYNAPTVDIYDLTNGPPRLRIGDVPVGIYDPDNLPNAQAIAIVGDRAYITLDVLDSTFTPRSTGRVVVVDTGTFQPVGTLDLHYANPYNFFQPLGDKLLVVSEGDFSGTTGCIEQLAPGGNGQVMPCLLENSVLGGTVGPMSVGGDDVYFTVSTYDAQFHPTSQIRRVHKDGTLSSLVVAGPGQTPSDVAWAPGVNLLVYGDTKAGGLRVWDPAQQKELTTTALDIGLPPAAVNSMVCMPRP